MPVTSKFCEYKFQLHEYIVPEWYIARQNAFLQICYYNQIIILKLIKANSMQSLCLMPLNNHLKLLIFLLDYIVEFEKCYCL